jgi:hypothetical protein
MRIGPVAAGFESAAARSLAKWAFIGSIVTGK